MGAAILKFNLINAQTFMFTQQVNSRITQDDEWDNLGGCWWNQFKGCCCKDKYEYSWLKQESCCFICGIRCALLTLNIFCILDGFFTFALGIYFVKHRSIEGAIVDCIFGILLIIFAVIGYYGTLKTNEFFIRIFWYWSIAVIPLMIGICLWAIIEFIISDNRMLITVMTLDLIVAVLLWIYIAYKVKRFYDLVFSHYQQLSDGIKEEMSAKK
eukprot:458536_1